MARRSRRKKNKTVTGAINKITKTLTSAAWFGLVIVVLYFVGRYVADDAYSSELARDVAGCDLESVKMPKGIDNTKVVYKGFTVYFNSKYHVPNCVIYELTGKETDGKVPRYKNFLVDEQVYGCAEPQDYTHSGYTRGHMAPAADMKWDREVMKESFYMTNICPQKASLNSGGWSKLEDKARDWARRDSAIIIASGPIFGSDMKTIGDSRVVVPEKFYKVVLAPFAAPMRAIGFIYPNGSSKGSIKNYAVTVDEVEALTGLDFFHELDDSTESRVESSFNLLQWDITR